MIFFFNSIGYSMSSYIFEVVSIYIYVPFLAFIKWCKTSLFEYLEDTVSEGLLAPNFLQFVSKRAC